MDKPHATLLLLGPRGHGKTGLATGLRRASRSAGQPREQVASPLRAAAVTITQVATELESSQRRYTLLDPGDPQAVRTRLLAGNLAGLAAIDGAVLVVAAGLRHGPELADDLRLLQRVGVADLVVVLDRAPDEDVELVDLAEQELREALCAAEIAGDTVPIVRASIAALRDGTPSEQDVALTLLDLLDHHIAVRGPATPRWLVTRVLAPVRRAPVVECRVLEGTLAPGDALEVVGLTPSCAAQLVSADAEDSVRCTLRGVTSGDLRVGQVLARPGTLAAHHRFAAEVHLFAPRAQQVEEWQFAWSDVVTVGGLATPLGDSSHGYAVELATALALTPGDGFGIVAYDETIGFGIIVAVGGAGGEPRRGGRSPTGLAVAFVDSLHRGDRPDVAASRLLPPDEILQATAPAFATDLQADLRSGRLLLRFIRDGRRGPGPDVYFEYKEVLARRASVEYVGPCELDPGSLRHLGRGSPHTVDIHHERREYRLDAGFTVSRIRFPIAVTSEGTRETMVVELRVAEFDAQPGVWYLFEFAAPFYWQTL